MQAALGRLLDGTRADRFRIRLTPLAFRADLPVVELLFPVGDFASQSGQRDGREIVPGGLAKLGRVD